MTIESPKQRFLKTPAAKELAGLLENPLIQVAMDVTMLQMLEELAASVDATGAAANWLRREGARRFARTFLKLSDKDEPVNYDRPRDNVPHPD